MASKTAETQYHRKIRNQNAGRARKRALENKGTTPPFSVHTEEADANAPGQARNEPQDTGQQAS